MQDCNKPIRIYIKLNKPPNPQSLQFDKKTDSGNIIKSDNKTNIHYNIEYSPCEYNINDDLFVSVVGFEGKSTFSIKVYFVYSNKISIKCNNNENELFNDKDMIDKFQYCKRTNKNITELPKFPEINMDLEGFKKFFRGVLEGVSSVPFEKNICYTSIVDIKIEDVKALFDKLSKSIQDRSARDFYTSILEVLKLLNKLNDANKNCNISALIKSIGVYATPYAGVAKLIYNIASNYSVYYDDITAAYTDLTNMDWQKSGADTGRILSTLLGWKTS